MSIEISEMDFFNVRFEDLPSDDLYGLLIQHNLHTVGPRGGVQTPNTRGEKIALLRNENIPEGPYDISANEHRRLVWRYTLENRAGQQENRVAGNAIQQWAGNMAESLVRIACGLGAVYTKIAGTDPDLELNDCYLDVKAMISRNYNEDGFRGTGGWLREPKNNLVPPDPEDENHAYIFVRVRGAPNATGEDGSKMFPDDVAPDGCINYVNGSKKIGLNANPEFTATIIGWLSHGDTFLYPPLIPGGRGGGGVSEGGMTWIHYQISDNLEVFDHGLNEINELTDITGLTQDTIENQPPPSRPFLTTVDAHRVAIGLLGRGIISNEIYGQITESFEFPIPREEVPTILQPTQYRVLLQWCLDSQLIEQETLNEFNEIDRRRIANEVDEEEE